MTGPIPNRRGPRPGTTDTPPHSQIDQLAPANECSRLSAAIVAQCRSLAGVEPGMSRRAPPGSVGFYLRRSDCVRDPEAFLLDNEIAHVHGEDDGSLHTVLPEGVLEAAIDAGWAELHPMAGMPTVSPRTVMIYAPRDDRELSIVCNLVREAWKAAHVQPREKKR